jgi:hypothetical protein
MTIRLKNTTRRLQVFVLVHEHHCAALGRCTCDLRKDGRRLPASLTLPAGEYVEAVDAILRLPTMVSALRAGDIQLIQEKTDGR